MHIEKNVSDNLVDTVLNIEGKTKDTTNAWLDLECTTKDVENDYINVLEIVISHRVDDHIEDDTLCRTDVDPIIIERPIVRHVPYDFIDDVDEHLSHASDEEL